MAVNNLGFPTVGTSGSVVIRLRPALDLSAPGHRLGGKAGFAHAPVGSCQLEMKGTVGIEWGCPLKVGNRGGGRTGPQESLPEFGLGWEHPRSKSNSPLQMGDCLPAVSQFPEGIPQFKMPLGIILFFCE